LKAKGDFAVCGRRQGLLALDLGRFFCKKSSAKKLQKGFATSSTELSNDSSVFCYTAKKPTDTSSVGFLIFFLC